MPTSQWFGGESSREHPTELHHWQSPTGWATLYKSEDGLYEHLVGVTNIPRSLHRTGEITQYRELTAFNEQEVNKRISPWTHTNEGTTQEIIETVTKIDRGAVKQNKTEHEIVKSQYDAYHAYSPEAVTGYRNWTQETEKTIRAEDTYPAWAEVVKTTTDETLHTKTKSRSLFDDRDRNSFVEAFAHVNTETKQLEGTKQSVGQGDGIESTETSKYRHTTNSIGKIHQKETRKTTHTESTITSGTYENQTIDRALDRTYVGTNGAVEVVRYTSKDQENRATTTTNRQSYDIDAGY